MHIFFADKGDDVYDRMKSQGTKIPAETLLCLYTKSNISNEQSSVILKLESRNYARKLY